jgi:hypothetical protein
MRRTHQTVEQALTQLECPLFTAGHRRHLIASGAPEHSLSSSKPEARSRAAPISGGDRSLK